MRNIKLTIEYDGTDYAGWQAQNSKFEIRNSKKDKQKLKTIQGTIEEALQKIFKKKIHLIGSGRTDAGVHAKGQVANFKVDTLLDCRSIKKALNANLPEDITVLKAEDAPLDFHARYSVKSKLYRYTILNQKHRSSLKRRFVHFVPYKLDASLMKKEAKALVGQHDFKSFQTKANKEKSSIMLSKTADGEISPLSPSLVASGGSSIRTIKHLDIIKRGNLITIDVEASGFLYNMARNIAGTLIDIGRGRFPKGSMPKILAKKDITHCGSSASAKGLCLIRVSY